MSSRSGVNLGGWLVLERWISPSVFKGTAATDEYSLSLGLGTEEAIQRITRHRDTFITEKHVEKLAGMGIQQIRVPIGYWLFSSEPPFIDGADTYIDRLFEWVRKYNLGAVLDFHAAPGSQNGWDHSGRAGKIDWFNPENVEKSLSFITALTQKYGHETNLVGIEPLNEPHWEVPLVTLVEYYRKAGEIIKRNCSTSVRVIVSDAFRHKEMSKALRAAGLDDFVIDTHLYQLYTPEDRALDLEGHLKKVNTQWVRELKTLCQHYEIIVGEWSAAMDEQYLPELKIKARQYDEHDYAKYFDRQRKVFEEARADWFYWTARTEDGGVWSLLDHPELMQK